MLHTKIDGSRLAGNLLGDPTERDLFVYLPPGYDEAPCSLMGMYRTDVDP